MTDQSRDENPSETQRDEYPNLPYALTLFCQLECRTMTFWRKHGSLYECPCGEFQWDIFSKNPEKAGTVLRFEGELETDLEDESDNPGIKQERNLRNVLGTISTLTPSAGIRRIVLAQIRAIQVNSYLQGVNNARKDRCPKERDIFPDKWPCPNKKELDHLVYQCDECPNRKLQD